MPKKKKNQNSKRNSSRKNGKESNIGSSSLLPARTYDEKPDTPYTPQIKKEKEDLSSLFTMIRDSKNSAIISEGAQSSNHSDTSTATEPMETNEAVLPINGSYLPGHIENQVMPPFFEGMHVKKESIESEIVTNQNFTPSIPNTNNTLAIAESGIKNVMPDNHTENSPKSKIFIPAVNGQKGKKLLDNNNEILKKFTDQDKTNRDICIKTEPVEKNESTTESQNNSSHEKKKRKMKQYLEEKLQFLRKRFKSEPNDNDQNTPTNENQVVALSSMQSDETRVKKEMIDDESSEDTDEDADVAILPVPKVEKFIDVVIISDDDEHEKKSESQNEDIQSNQNSCPTPLQVSTAISPTKPFKERNFSLDILKYFSVVSELDRYDCQTTLNYLSKYRTKNTLAKFFPIIKEENKSTQNIKKRDILFQKIISEADSDTKSASISSNITHSNSNELVEPAFAYASFPNPSLSNTQSATSTSNYSLTVGNLQEILRNATKTANENSNAAATDPRLSLQEPCYKKIRLENGENITNTATVPSISSCPVMPLHNNNLQIPALPGTALSQIPSCPVMPSTSHNFQPVIPFQVPSHPAVSSNNHFKIHPVFSTSHPAGDSFTPIASSSLPVNRDPRLSANKILFPPRKGTENHQLYKNVGKDDITKYFETLILQWNPAWMAIQLETNHCAPICDSYPTVLYFYPNEMAYYNTYVPLHLLHIWNNIINCWTQNKTIRINNCKVQSVEKVDNRIKISCSTELEDTDVWPKRDDIIWCKHNEEDAFLRVEDVRKRPTNKGTRKKLKIFLESLHNFNFKVEDEIRFFILLNIRTFCLEAEALNCLDISMKELVLKPEMYSDCIEVFQLDINRHCKDNRDDILNAICRDIIRMVVIETYHSCDIYLLITLVTYSLVKTSRYHLTVNHEKRPNKILIILKNDDSFHKLYKRLNAYNPVLAVRTKQIQLPPDCIKHTFEDRLEKKENINDILNNHNIFLTTFSAFGSAEKAHISKLKKLICIIDDASSCTEAETALPLTLKLHKLLLIGNREQNPHLPSMLLSYKYHISLFVRLLRAKQKL